MKKLLLTLGVVGIGFASKAQVIFSVEEPASIADFYDFTSNGDGSNWGLANLNGVYVIDTIALADDGTSGTNAQGNPASATGCTALPAGSLDGKIAMVFRYDGVSIGSCDFGLKALNCQDAGAEAVIIVNREDALINMDGGAVNGVQVNIPVIFVSLSTGQAILDAMDNGDDVIGFIGDKTGYYDDDLSIFDNQALRADFGAFPLALAQNDTELSVPLGLTVYNFGNNDQTGVTVTATVTHGTEVYNEVSNSFPLNSGDTVFLTFPNFDMPTYTAGEYVVNYEINMGVTDEFLGDNVVTSSFFLTDSAFSMAGLTAGDVAKDGYYRPSTLPTTNQFSSCALFRNANASRLRTDGLWYGGITIGGADTADVNLEDQILDGYLYEWNDAWTTAQDATFNNLNQVGNGTFDFSSGDAGTEETIFIPFEDVVQLENNQNYLMCIIAYEKRLYHAMDTKTIYDFNAAQTSLPRFPIQSGDQPADWNALGFGIAGSIVLNVGEDLNVVETEVESTVYPNPTKDQITVMVNANGKGTLKVTDMAGRLVATQDVTVANGKFTTSAASMNNGVYIFSIDFENGSTTKFNVVVSK